MLRRVSFLFGYAIEARDGRIGKVEDLYFDDHVWRVRYLVAETGGWLTRKDVLISPAALDPPRAEEKSFPVKITREQVRNSPEVDTDLPVSRQMEESMRKHYGWPSYWMVEPVAGGGSPELAAAPATVIGSVPQGDPHLRSVREIIGYEVSTRDEAGKIAKVSDFLVDDEEWMISYIVAKTTSKDPEAEIVLDPRGANEFEWSSRSVEFNLPASLILSSPRILDDTNLDSNFEDLVQKHFGRSSPGRIRL